VRRRQRKLVSTIAAAGHTLEPDVAALGTLHGSEPAPEGAGGSASAVAASAIS